MEKYQRRSVRLKKLVLEWADAVGSVTKACREWEVPRSTFYRWKTAYDKHGIEGLVPGKPIAKSHPRQLPPEVIEKILYLRQNYHFGPQRIAWYMERYHGVKTSCSSIYRTLVRHDLSRLPRNVGRRAIHTQRLSFKSLQPLLKRQFGYSFYKMIRCEVSVDHSCFNIRMPH